METAESASGLRMTQACDICRARKIKCDRKTPCSSCSAAQISCRTTKRAPEKKKRIFVSAGYEKEVQGVNERLASLEKTIHALVVAPKAQDAFERPHVALADATPRGLDESNNDTAMSFEGASSFAAHSKATSQAFQLAVNGSQSAMNDFPPSPATTVSSKALPTNADLASRVTKPSAKTGVTLTPASHELPPLTLTLSLLRFARGCPLKIFSDFPSLRLDSFSALCQKVCFPIEECTQAQFALFNSVLYFCWADMEQKVKREQSFDESDIALSIDICKKNLEELARKMPMVMDDHSLEAIQAITLMACYFLDTSRPSLSWKFASAAARLCQDAGYHCLQKDSDVDDLYLKILTFWHVFSLDRSLSLNFGRSPTIQDYDVTCPRPEADHSGDLHDSAAVLGYVWVELAFMQGEVFALLYSNRAQMEPPENKIALARTLGVKLQSVRQKWLMSYNPDANRSDAIRDAMDGTNLILMSNLVLIYRMIPPTMDSAGQSSHNPLIFSEECISVSRTALEAYNSAWEKYQQRDDNGWKSMINWTYISSPFTAFLVVFGTVISFRSKEDLDLLERSVKVLESAAEFSLAVLNLLSACAKFYQFAKQYMCQPNHTQQSAQDSTMDYQMPNVFDPIEWDTLLNEWDLGLGGENAREMSTFLSGFTCNPTSTWLVPPE